MFSQRVGALLALTHLVSGVAFKGPAATPVVKRWDVGGWTPKPTSQPQPLLELFRRQEDPSFCGFLEGDPDYAVTCQLGRSCMYDESYSWFGCCTGSYVEDCNVNTACVQSSSVSACLSDSSCYNDPLLTACTARTEGYCMALYTVITGNTYSHWECAATDATYEVISSAASGGFLIPTETDEFLTLTETEESSSRTRPRFTLESTSTEDEESSTTESESATSTDATTEAATTASETAASATAESTGAAPMKTAEAMLGAVGGIAGLLAVFL